MGVGFYSKIRSGENSDTASVNDIYQKLKEGIIGFSIADVLEDRIRTLIESLNIIETFRLHTITLNDDDKAQVQESVFSSFIRKIAVRLLPAGNDGLKGQDIPVGNDVVYNNKLILLPVFGPKPNSVDYLQHLVWLVVKGEFDIKTDGFSLLNSTDISEFYDANDGNFHSINYFFSGVSTDSVKYGLIQNIVHTLTNKSVTGNPDRPANVLLDRNVTFTGQIRAIWCNVEDNSFDTNSYSRVDDGVYDLTNIEFGLFGTGDILCSSRLPMFLA